MRLKTFLTYIFAAVALIVSACSARQVDQSAQQSAGAFVSSHITVKTTGTGPDVILLPGLASNVSVWDDTIASLQDRYKLHAVQVNGFGGAPGNGNIERVDILPLLSDEMIRYADTLDDEPALIGHSLGGLVALMAGLQNPDAFDRLMVIDVLPFFSVLTTQDATAEMIAPFAVIARDTLVAQSDDEFAARQAEALNSLVKSEEDRELTLSWSIQSDRGVMAQAMSEVLVTDLREEMSKLELPLTVLYAHDDQILNMKTIEELYLQDYQPAPNVNIVPVDGALHFIMLDQPGKFLNVVNAFLAADRPGVREE